MTVLSQPEPFENIRATARQLRGRSPTEFQWFIKALEDLKSFYFEACATAAPDVVLKTQGHAQCVANLLHQIETDAQQ